MIDELPFVPVVRELVGLLVEGNFAEVERRSTGRLSAAELATAVSEYPGTLVPLPAASTELWDITRHHDGGGWAVVVPLWTREEGRSDLSLELTVREGSTGKLRVEVDNLHVL
jgi:hypothetical protein